MQSSGWPPLGSARGRLIFVIHTDDAIDPLYVAGDGSGTGSRRDALFVIHNDPDPDSIAACVNDGLIVRTRADADYSAVRRRETAIVTGSPQSERLCSLLTENPDAWRSAAALIGLQSIAPGKRLCAAI